MIIFMLAFVHACATAPVDHRGDDADNQNEKYDAVSSASTEPPDSHANGASVDWLTLTLLGLIALARGQRTSIESNYPGSKAADISHSSHHEKQ